MTAWRIARNALLAALAVAIALKAAVWWWRLPVPQANTVMLVLFGAVVVVAVAVMWERGYSARRRCVRACLRRGWTVEARENAALPWWEFLDSVEGEQ